MIKTIIMFVENEIEAAEDYVEMAYAKRHTCTDTASLFISLANEEIAHAERLLKRGQIIIDKVNTDKSSPNYEHDLKNRAVWDHVHEKASKEISELHAMINGYKSNY